MKRSLALLTAAFSIFVLAGCTSDTSQQTGEGAAERAGKAVDAAGAEVKEETKDAAQAVEKTAVEAGEATADAADTASMTARIRTAVVSADGLKIDDLNVDTMADTKTVTLSGKAANAADKSRAESVAKGVIDPKTGYKLVNNITVGGAD